MTHTLSRRTLLKSAPAAIVGTTTAAILSHSDLAQAASAAEPAAHRDAYGEWSALTYLSLECQKQRTANEQAVGATPYAPYLDTDLSVPSASAKALQFGPLDPGEVPTPSAQNLNRLIDPSFKTKDNGYAVLDGQMAYAQSRIVMPGVTTEMFKWWFTWHPVEKERYMLWFPQAHIDTSVADPSRLKDTSLSYEKRLFNNPNRIQEWIGPSRLDAIIHFSEPATLGFDAQALAREGFTASASAVCYATPAPDIPFTLMVHIARDTSAGMELFSRYWIGAHADMARFANAEKAPAMLQKIGFNEQVAESTAYEMSVHDMTEFNHLARILPGVHHAFGS
ncbi:DAPG hydrolase family protein [Agrobacterium sp. ES01]|uniref:DAPG hydrolase family protein n=1 Tax=Agrobacterium sp. ES01 TaxID=3420714 RepID=UPI003D141273